MFNKLFKKLSWLFRTEDSTREFTTVPAPANWQGIPEPGLTWKEVSKIAQTISPIIPFTFLKMPEKCPICNGPLTDYESDFCQCEEDGSGQYFVIGKYCSKGHWTHLDWA